MSKRRSRGRNHEKIKKVNFIYVISILIVLLILFFLTFLSLLNMGNSKILHNIYINNISISSLSPNDAKEKINSELNKKLTKPIKITFENYSIDFLPAEIDFHYDTSSALEKAYSIGRTGNIFTNNSKILTSLFKKTNLNAEYSYNEEKLNNIINNISVDIPNLVIEPSYYISDDTLIVTKGTDGNELDKSKTITSLLSAIINNEETLTLPINYTTSQSINIDKIHNEIYCEPQNASVTKNPYKVSAEKDGIDFAISIDEAKELALNKNASEIYIPLKYIKPEITIADLGEDIFGTKLGTSTTIYDSTNFNRSTNIDIACERINGIILEPGETFSFNKVVGERTAKNGFKEALIYNGGEVDYGLGGGICQISSTLYNAVLKANLEIVERKNHSMTVSYLPIGQDASVSYGSVDFKFTNSRTYPIKIVATAKAGVITVSVLGVLEKQEYVVTFETEILETTDYKTTYEYSSSVPVGKEEIKQVGKNGYKCSTYKILSLGEKEVSRTLLSTDTYKSQKEIILKHK